MKVRVSNIKGLQKYLKKNKNLVQDVTDRSMIGERYCTLSPHDFLELDDLSSDSRSSKFALLSDTYIFIVNRDKEGKVSSCEAVQNNRNNHQLVHKYITEGHLDSYDEFVRI